MKAYEKKTGSIRCPECGEFNLEERKLMKVAEADIKFWSESAEHCFVIPDFSPVVVVWFCTGCNTWHDTPREDTDWLCGNCKENHYDSEESAVSCCSGRDEDSNEED